MSEESVVSASVVFRDGAAPLTAAGGVTAAEPVVEASQLEPEALGVSEELSLDALQDETPPSLAMAITVSQSTGTVTLFRNGTAVFTLERAAATKW